MRGRLARLQAAPATAVVALLAVALVLAVVARIEFGSEHADAGPRLSDSTLGRSADLAEATYVLDCGREAVQRPARLAPSCGPDGPALADLRWADWGGARAEAVGRWVVPCAGACEGRREDVAAATAVLERVRPASRTAVYTELVIRVVGRPPLRFDLAPGARP
ncbi:hypothetical protein K8Z61_15465 [Nocardioides sp. TRM66260-LWL]|uniref:hypothetical protein n=1 Tax=Nocardioides sp. TRM66260-LWL TaxID=2874478 RepID=UPI001CC4183C|nr:hypothetical protein [Nocardioides sp. TRM66260-LWL]MBZ5735892.1 hypothetical protein [Nocardioides sp. TRM66260-LWL]